MFRLTLLSLLVVSTSYGQPKKPKSTPLEGVTLASEWKTCLADAEKLSTTVGVTDYEWVLVDCPPYVKGGATLTKKYIQQPKLNLKSVCITTVDSFPIIIDSGCVVIAK